MDYIGKESSKVVPLRLPEKCGRNDWKTLKKDLQVTARTNAGFEPIQYLYKAEEGVLMLRCNRHRRFCKAERQLSVSLEKLILTIVTGDV
jgi:hypothetical protein